MPLLEGILAKIGFPNDLKKLSVEELTLVCTEIRTTIIEVISENPGHFGASMGAVELAVAIHSVFETPNDKVVWDVGHQSYAHKIITGRKPAFNKIRKMDGISGFPKMSESDYDAFGTGHSSTSISAISGLAVASMLNGELSRQHIAVIGDGALTGGMAFEALNNLVELDANILVIVNDNQMSIDSNVGGLEVHLTSLNSDTQNIFQNLGLNYIGSVDGNNMGELMNVLQSQKNEKGVRILHCKTTKGFGYFPAENGDATTWHAPGRFNSVTGEIQGNSGNLPEKYQDVFGKCLVDLAKNNKDIVAVTPAMMSGSSLNQFKDYFPDRFFDVGIAEQHAVTFSAGLAANGKLPFCVIYSSFLQRAYDQIIHDVALQNLPVIFCIDRAGLVGEDGATHHGAFDIAFLRCIPNLTIMSPLDEQEFVNMLYSVQLNCTGPVAIRYPRGRGVMRKSLENVQEISFGTGKQIKEGEDVAVLSFGHVGNEVIKATNKLSSEGKEVAHFDMRFAKPLDKNLLHHIFNKFNSIITIEDGVVMGGIGSAVLEFKEANGYDSKVNILGLPDSFVEHGTKEELQKEVLLDSDSILKKVEGLF